MSNDTCHQTIGSYVIEHASFVDCNLQGSWLAACLSHTPNLPKHGQHQRFCLPPMSTEPPNVAPGVRANIEPRERTSFAFLILFALYAGKT